MFLSRQTFGTLGLTAILLFLVGPPLVSLLYGSFRNSPPGRPGEFTLENFATFFSPNMYGALLDTFLYATASTLLAIFLGTTLAWVLERTHIRFKRAIVLTIVLTIATPHILVPASWIMLASPRIGLFNNLLRPFFGPEFVLFNVYSWTGLILITGISSSTLAFLLMAAAVRNIDPHFEEAAMSSGAGTFTILRRVTFPLLKPAMLTVFLLLFVNVIQYFETPFILGWQAGIRVFSAWVYSYTRLTPTDYGAASALSLLYLAIMAIGVFAYLRVVKSSHKYATVTPKAFRSRQIELGKGKIIAVLFLIVYLLLHTILPFAIVLWAAFTPYFVQPSFKALSLLTLEQFQYAFAEPSLLKAFVNTMIMATSAATVVVILTAIIAWVVIKTKLPGRGLLDGLAFSTTAYPGIVLSLGLFWFYVQFPMGIYGTLLVLTLATITNYTAHGVRFASGTIIQIHKDLEEVATASGASWFYTFRRIILPLMKGGLLGAWVYVAFSSMRDLSTYLLLYTNESIIMSVIMFDHWYGGAYNGLSATALIMMVSMGGVIVTSRALLGGLHLKERLRE